MARRRIRFVAGDVLETKLVQRASMVPVRVNTFRGILVDKSVSGDALRYIRAHGQARERARRLKPVQ